ncbi:MAG: Ig-like domain-containing protein [Proteobacteria bacterium]|nr:Ig-like domain-containing protein [Pseudomonadota bacterium]
MTINPTGDLAASTDYYIVLASGVILDSAGNAYAGISSTTALNFTTASGADTTPPTLSGTSPADNAAGVAVGANITMTFNEAVKAGSGVIEIHRTVDGGLVTSISITDSSQVTISGSTVTINPTSDLAANTGYYIVLASGVILDTAGNVYAGISSNSGFNFQTAVAADTTPPTLTSANPSDNSTGVAPDLNFVLTFNEAVKAGTGVIEIHKSSNNALVTSIAITDSSQITISGSTVTINPAANLSANTGYYIVLASGVILDSAGNAYAGISSTTALNFTTGLADITPPLLNATQPADNDTHIMIGGNITLIFDSIVRAGTGVIEIHRASDGALVDSISITDTSQVAFDGSTVIVNPAIDLAYGTEFYVLIAPGVILDTSGNSYAGISSPTAFSFTTMPEPDIYPPTLLSFSPADNATGVAVNTNLVLTFSEPVTIQPDGQILIHRASDGAVVATVSLDDSTQVSVSGNTFTINLANDLRYGTDYYVTISVNAVYDPAQNYYAGLSDTTAFTFSTVAAPEFTPPVLLSSSPADNGSGVAVDANIVLTFSEAVVAGIGTIEIHRSSDGSTVETIGSNDTSKVTISGNVVTINPSATLDLNTSYYVVITPDAIEDVYNNPYAGITSTTALNFVTGNDSAPPVLVSSFANTNGVQPNGVLTLKFNEPVQAGSGVIEIHQASDGALVRSISITDTSQVSFVGAFVNINPTDDLSYNTEYYVLISPGAILDTAGNPYAGVSSPTALDFTTAHDGTPPTLVSSSPADDAVSVPVGANIVLTFSEAVKAGTGAIGPIEVHRSSDGALVASFSVADTSVVTISGNTVTINLSSDLAANTGYYVIIPTGTISDLGDNAFAGLTSSTALNFTTGTSSDSTPPTLMSSSPADNATGVAVGTNITMTFNEAVRAGTGSIEIHRSSDGSLVTSIAVTDSSQVTFSGSTVSINPTADLAVSTGYYIVLGSGVILDVAGNAFAGISSSTAFNFTTAVDSVPPTLTSTSPGDNATGVLVGANITMTFSEAVKAGSGAIEIHRSSDGSLVASISVTDTSQVTISGSTVTINPTSDLAANTDYYIVLASGVILDSAGNAYAGISSNSVFNFTTTADATPPTLISSNPADDATGVVLQNNTIVLTFSEAVKVGIGHVQIHLASDGTIVGDVPVTDGGFVSISGNAVTITGFPNLASSTGYYITIDAGAFLDTAGNAYAGISSNTALNFTTAGGDVTPPTLTSSSPADNAVDVAIGTNIVLTFSEAVQIGTGTIEIHRSSDGSLVTSIFITDSSQVTFSGNTVTINPTSDLVAGTGYYIEIDGAAIQDLAGNDYAGIRNATGLNFFTGDPSDTTSPTLISASPADDAAAVAIDANIVLTFSEPVTFGSGQIEIHRSSDGGLVASLFVNDPSVTFSGNTVTINPPFDLASGTGYYLIIPSGAILDFSGNAYAGISSSTTLNFTTGGDVTPPTLISSSPADDATGVAVGADIVLTFSEAVRSANGFIQIHRAYDGSVAMQISIGDGLVSISGNTVTINLPVDMDPAAAYYVTIDAGALLDMAGNPYAGISSSTAFNFTTGGTDSTPPLMIGGTPFDDSIGVPVDSNIVLIFNEAIKAGNGAIEIHRSSDGSLVTSISITDSSQIAISGNTVTINPASDLAGNTGYYIVMASGVILDMSNNAFAGISSNTTYNFTTASSDTTPPTLSSTSPTDDATGVAVGANIVLTFSEAVKAGAGAIEIHRSSDGSLVTSISITDSSQVTISGSTVTINPTSDLAANTGYYIVMASGVIFDLGGNPYAGVSSTTALNFTTGAADTTPPTLSSSSPADDATGVAVGANIVLTFSEAVKVGSGQIEIHRSSDGALVASPFVNDPQVTFSGNTVTIDLPNDLASNTGYYIVIPSGAILDLAGNTYAGISSSTALNFTTAADTTAPTLTSSSPADDATGVAVGTNIVLTFSEAVKAGSGAIEIHRSSDGSLVTSISVTDTSQVTISGSTVTINPTSDLAANTGYYIVLASGVILDSAGNAYAGISSNSAFNFTTAAAADTTPPTLSSTSPADNATGVAVGANIVLTFSETVKAGTGYIVIHNVNTGALIRIAVTDTSQVTISGNTVTINPTADLSPNTPYYVTMISGAIKDVAGNNYAGIITNTAFNFTTTAAAAPSSLSITAGADKFDFSSHGSEVDVMLAPGHSLLTTTSALAANHSGEVDSFLGAFTGQSFVTNPIGEVGVHAGQGFVFTLPQVPHLHHEIRGLGDFRAMIAASGSLSIGDKFDFSAHGSGVDAVLSSAPGLPALAGRVADNHTGELESSSGSFSVIDPIGEIGVQPGRGGVVLPHVPHVEILEPGDFRTAIVTPVPLPVNIDADKFDFAPRGSVAGPAPLPGLGLPIPASALADHHPGEPDWLPGSFSQPHLVIDPLGEVGVHAGHGLVIALPHIPQDEIDGV